MDIKPIKEEKRNWVNGRNITRERYLESLVC